MNYEQSMVRLEQIISALSNGNISLQDSLELFSEGAKLVEQCNNYLNTAKLKIEELTGIKDVE